MVLLFYLCYNNFCTKTAAGNKIQYYRVSKSPERQQEYLKILMTSGINWDKGQICSEN